MKRILFVVAAMVVGLSGCASPARYVEMQSDSGVVAIPANTDVWPTFYRTRALEKIQEHVGPNYEIIDQRQVTTGQTTVNNQQVNATGVSGVTTTQETTEWRIAYRKKQGSGSVTPTMPGMPGASGVQQTQFRPGMGTGGVQPAGGMQPQGAPVNPVVPSVAPVNPAGGSGVYGSGGATFGGIR